MLSNELPAVNATAGNPAGDLSAPAPPVLPVLDDLLIRWRNGDSQVLGEIHSLYGEELRKVARLHLNRLTLLRKAVDSTDIWQMVLAQLLRPGRQLKVRDTEKLLKYLERAVTLKVFEVWRRSTSLRRDIRRETSEDAAQGLAGMLDSPSHSAQVADLRELAAQILTEDEQMICELYRADCTFDEIGLFLDITAENARKRFSRAQKRLKKAIK